MRLFQSKHARQGKRETARRRNRWLRPSVMELEPRTLLSTLIVLNTNDSGAGSLRAAVLQANTDGGGDTINFSNLFNTPQTITLTSGQLLLTGTATTTISGPGANLLSVNGNNASRVFAVYGGSAALSGLTITGGSADRGGGLRNIGGTLSLVLLTVHVESSSRPSSARTVGRSRRRDQPRPDEAGELLGNRLRNQD